MENITSLILCMALPAAICLIFALADVITDILNGIIPGAEERQNHEIERMERWQKEDLRL
jgi:hypothetical protein